MIENDGEKTTYTLPDRGVDCGYDAYVIAHIAAAYAYIIKGRGRMTFAEFAKCIEGVYDTVENRVNREVCRVLRHYSAA